MVRLPIVAVLIASIVLLDARIVLRRDRAHPKYEKLDRADPNRIHEIKIALKQQNLDVLEAKLLDASNPDSVNYGKWWTTEQILDLVAPPVEEVQPVISWLVANGVHNIDMSGRDFIKVRSTIGMFEKIFKTEMYNYRSTETGGIVARVFGPAHIPDHLSIVEMVFGLSELVPLPSNSPKIRPIKERSTEGTDPMGFVYPGLLRQMYKVPSSYAVNPKSSLGVVQYQFQNVLNARSYDPDDIGLFNAGMNEKIHVDKIVGPFSKQTTYEPTLDVEYGSASGLNTTFWYWTEMIWMYDFATHLFNAQTYPLVVSMSYGWPEDGSCTIDSGNCGSGSPSDYVRRTDAEFMKITMKGVTLISSSGDQGAPGDENPFCGNKILSTMYPATSPWVTSVGATMLIPGGSTLPVNQPPVCQQQQCATTGLEGVCTWPTSLITTGGGFSGVNSVPGWQQTAVNNYLNSGVALPPSGTYNAAGRAFPDVSANGHNYLISFSPYGFEQIDGTSASTPLFAGMIALLNSLMLNNGKPTLGFINPLLYKMAQADPTTFTDITTGNNYCTENCCTTNLGFVATPGWDPVTGLGTPVFSRIQNYLIKNVL